MPTPPPGPLPAPLSLVGGLLIAVGGAGDLAYHGALPYELALAMGPLIGADGQRAHLVVFLGMLAILAPPSYRFEPAAIQVAAGTGVTFRNADNFTHTVHVQGDPDRQVQPGKSIQIAFETPGEFPYLCTLHAQNMKGTVIVTGP